ncbi:MAG TPA: hypothetical protein VHM90_22570 [Phycisphaerae bacterium]|nr:hypothetical protein [Phycisphaerae bacterium]
MTMRDYRRLWFVLPILLGGCQQPVKPAGAIGDDRDLRDTLAAMARAHDQKTQLAFYEALPWQRTAEPFHDFFVKMGKSQRELHDQLQTWAKTADQGKPIVLKYSYGDDTPGRAQKIIEARQEKLIRGDSKPDFTRDALMQMYEDYEWQISLIQALLPRVTDSQLRAYLEKSLKVHQEGSDELIGLLRRFKA